MQNRFLSTVLATVIAFVISTASHAATLQVSGSGDLLGVRGLDVGGTLYDVTFTDGSCASLFNGCDETSDFLFADSNSARDAGVALGQSIVDVPLGNFDSNPRLTNGCSSSFDCYMYIPYGENRFAFGQTFTDQFYVAAVRNRDRFSNGVDVSSIFINTTFNPTSSSVTWAVFAPAVAVPLPVPALLLVGGLAGLGLLRRRKAV